MLRLRPNCDAAPKSPAGSWEVGEFSGTKDVVEMKVGRITKTMMAVRTAATNGAPITRRYLVTSAPSAG